MPKDPNESPKNSEKSSDQVSRPLRYTREQLLREGDVDKVAAPLPEPILDKSIAVDMIFEEISRVYPFGLANGEQLLKKLDRVIGILIEYEVMGSSSFLIGLQILERISQSDNGKLKADYTPYQLCAGALMLGSKFAEDAPYNNESWGRATGLSTANLNMLEVDIFKVLNFQAFDRTVSAQKGALYAQRLSEKRGPSSTTGSPF